MIEQWQHQLANAFTDSQALCDYLQLSPTQLNLSGQAMTNFPLTVPYSFASRMEKGNPLDPSFAANIAY
jgi:L-lysine 2,3-aminomutase